LALDIPTFFSSNTRYDHRGVARIPYA